MKLVMQRLVVVVAAVAVLVVCGNRAQAFPNAGPNCSGCHAAPGGSLDVLPSSLVEIQAGTTGQVTFDVTALPDPDAAIALSGLDDANLMATVGAGWALSANNQWASDPFFSSTGPQLLDLTIDAGAAVGEYGVGVQLAGGPGFQGWSSSYDFTLKVLAAVPEPGTLALLITGFGAVGMLALRRRRKVA